MTTNVSRREYDDEFVPSIYADRAYGLALTAGSSKKWSVFADDENLWHLAVVENPLPDGGYEACSPYGYPGIYAHSSLSPQQVSEYWELTVRAMNDAGIVSLFVRFPPFAYSGLGVEVFAGQNLMDLGPVSKTIEVETLSPDSVWAGMCGRARTAIRKAAKTGMTSVVTRASETTLGPNSAFRKLYDSTMNRIGATDQHVYGDAYYETLLSQLGDRIFVVNVSDCDGQPAASAMILIDGSVVHYHLSGSDPRAARDGANNLLLWTILEWSALQGFLSVHLGGGLSPGDSLFRFKESFGGESREFWVGRAVINRNRYDELTVAHAASLGTTVERLASAGFFPAFRAVPSC